MKSYSQIGQDLFVQKLIGNDGYFVELGGHLPIEINNTFLLESIGWNGISFDIVDYRKVWECRKTKLVVADATSFDFLSFFEENSVPKIIDYLSVDVELEGERYLSLVNCWKSNREYKIITIEHDSHLGYEESERKPQRDFLTERGYFLIFGNVKNKEGTPYEDWWINPNFFDMEKLTPLSSDGEYWENIIEKINKNL
jgi:hypothetical protein